MEELDEPPPALRSVRVSLPTDFSVAEVVDYIFTPDVVRRWLGPYAFLPLDPVDEAVATLPLATSPQETVWRNAEVVAVSDDRSRIAVRWSDAEGTVTFAVTERPLRSSVAEKYGSGRPSIRPRGRTLSRRPGGSYVRIVESELVDDEAARAALRTWQSALNELQLLLEEAMRLRLKTRQAIVLVHGIGEQRPGQILREFTSAIFPAEDDKKRYVKPDYLSPLFEMRKTTIPRDDASGIPMTDVYEMYWAHLVRDTTPAQVYGWMFRLLTAGRRIPPQLRKHVAAIWAVIIAAAILIVVLWALGVFSWLGALFAVGVLAIVPAVFWFVLRFVRDSYIVKFAGDAARYLEPRPENVALRQDIRFAGLDLIDELHDCGLYHRIIVFGHSLGSVIAYDILSQAWATRGRERDDTVVRTTSRSIHAVEDLLNPRPGEPSPSIEEIRGRQFEAWKEGRRNGFRWLVTDFVTAGSPLAHAPWLLELDRKTSFEDLRADRVFPTCPPQTESTRSPSPGRMRRRFTYTHSYREPGTDRTRSVEMPNHSALFAVTRWTNLTFPFSRVLHGDPVGGPLRESFGEWIRDIDLTQPEGVGFAHTWYLRPGKRDGSRKHIDELREALDLAFRAPLADSESLRLNPRVRTEAS